MIARSIHTLNQTPKRFRKALIHLFITAVLPPACWLIHLTTVVIIGCPRTWHNSRERAMYCRSEHNCCSSHAYTVGAAVLVWQNTCDMHSWRAVVTLCNYPCTLPCTLSLECWTNKHHWNCWDVTTAAVFVCITYSFQFRILNLVQVQQCSVYYAY